MMGNMITFITDGRTDRANKTKEKKTSNLEVGLARSSQKKERNLKAQKTYKLRKQNDSK